VPNRNHFQAKYTRAQREAAVRAVIVEDLSSIEAARRGREGKLEGAGRFDMTPAYIRKMVAQERAKINPGKLVQPGESERAIEQARARALSLILRAFERWEREAKTGHVDLTEHGKLMKALREHERGTGQGRTRAQPGHESDPHTDTPMDAATLLAALTQGARDSNGNGHADATADAASLPRRNATP
jgi:hypothetical protein